MFATRLSAMRTPPVDNDAIAFLGRDRVAAISIPDREPGHRYASRGAEDSCGRARCRSCNNSIRRADSGITALQQIALAVKTPEEKRAVVARLRGESHTRLCAEKVVVDFRQKQETSFKQDPGERSAAFARRTNNQTLDRGADGIVQPNGRSACRARDRVDRQVIERAPLRLADDERCVCPWLNDDRRCALPADAHRKRAAHLHRFFQQIENSRSEADRAARLEQLVDRLLNREGSAIVLLGRDADRAFAALSFAAKRGRPKNSAIDWLTPQGNNCETTVMMVHATWRGRV